MEWMFVAAMAGILVTLTLALVRAILGPTIYDRILAVNSFGTVIVLALAVIGYITGRPDFLDIALLYALINFVGTIAVLKFLRYGDLGKTTRPEDGGFLMAGYLDIAVTGLAWASLMAGALLCVIGGIGLHRFPDIYSRLHPVGVIDTGGVFFIIFGLLLRTPDWLTQVKLVILLALIFFTGPTATHAVAKAARTGQIAPWQASSGGGKDGSTA